MKKILLLIASLIVSAQAVCIQVNGVEKKKLEEQVVLVIKKYEGLGLSTEKLAEKVAADLLLQAQVLQDGVVVEGKSSFNKKLIIGAVVAIAACGVGYYVYTTYFAKKSLEEEKTLEGLVRQLLKRTILTDEQIKKIRKYMKKEPEKAADLAERLSKVSAEDPEFLKEFNKRLREDFPELQEVFK